ncbi:MAG: hypothetical protein ACFCUG_09395 [Thiotrichales bacterium]
MERRAEDYRWSSAAAHCVNQSERLLNPKSDWNKKFSETENCSVWLAEGDEADEIEILRRDVGKRLPCVSDGFIEKLGSQIGRGLEYRPQGRPGKSDQDE